jgi:Leucine-rich repeat (LRR) protein
MSKEENKSKVGEEVETETDTTPKQSVVVKAGEIWPEIKRVFENKRFEINLTGPEISKRIEANNGALDENLFKLKHVNFVEIARTKLASLSPSIGNMANLASLLCHSNELVSVPVEIGRLENLKNLDLSNNKITQLPTELKNLKELITLNLNGNLLESLFPLGELKKLSVLDIGRNRFKALPEDLGSADLENLAKIDASFNEIVELSESLADLPALKTLNLENNHLATLQPALCKCVKLKVKIHKNFQFKINDLLIA